MAKTSQELLDEVNDAISALVAGTIQSYCTPAGVEISKINLYQLRELRDQLRDDVTADAFETDGGYKPVGYRSGGAM